MGSFSGDDGSKEEVSEGEEDGEWEEVESRGSVLSLSAAGGVRGPSVLTALHSASGAGSVCVLTSAIVMAIDVD